MGLCVSKPTSYYTRDPDNFDRAVYATPIAQTRAEKSAAQNEFNQWANELRANGVKVGKVKTERFSYPNYDD